MRPSLKRPGWWVSASRNYAASSFPTYDQLGRQLYAAFTAKF
ncbi:MAG TPA: hypothetical protein VHV81_16330 [Steroidobacteraceae bacterium]|nr:hypothetical protein [Steroidobacteraceae bacterium]